MNIEFDKLDITQHAYDRIGERFPNAAKNKISALNFTRNMLKSSEYIGIVADKEGADSHMYSYNHDIAIHISIDCEAIKTIYKIDRDNRTFLSFRNSIEDIYKKEFRKIHRAELAKRRKLEYIKVKNEAEIASLKFRRHKTRSENVKKECDDLIAKLQREISEIQSEIKHAQTAKRNIAFALATNNF